MVLFVSIVFVFTLIVLSIFSYGFIDPNLTLSSGSLYRSFYQPLFDLVYHNRPVAAMIFFVILISLFISYGFLLWTYEKKIFPSWKKLLVALSLTSFILVLSYPALTYDLFNYIATAKVAYTYHENPYLVMPIEIPNDPNLAFTRAANKVSLYGPVWILITAIPHFLGGGNIWRTILVFKLLNGFMYICFSYLIYKVTKNIKNVLFFAFNPLVLIEILVSGHNDIYMMILALGGFYLWQKNRVSEKAAGIALFILSWFTKGTTVVLLPLIFLKKLPWDRLLFTAYCLLSLVFFVAAPLREELYPWYAVWLISIASCMDFKKQKFIIGFSIILSFALELRHLPYMWMGYYEGPGPILRFLLTVIPILGFLVFTGLRKIKIRNN